MKHLIKFNKNENIKKELDRDFLDDCFMDFIDNGSHSIIDPFGNYLITINIELEYIKYGRPYFEPPIKTIDFANELEGRIKISERVTEVLNEIKVAFLRISDKYPEYKTVSSIGGKEIEIKIGKN